MSIEWRRLGLFYSLTFLLLIAIPIIHALIASGPMHFDRFCLALSTRDRTA